MASLRTLAAGLDASDLATLPDAALGGLLPKAVTAMQAKQVKGFTPQSLTVMPRTVRDRLSGDRLELLSTEQIVAAVCGFANVSYDNGCPESIVDFTMSFPAGSTPTKQKILDHFVPKLTSVTLGDIPVHVLSVLDDGARPLMAASTSSRRLSVDEVHVTLRIDVREIGLREQAASMAQQEAVSFAKQGGGALVGNVTSFGVMPPNEAQVAANEASARCWPSVLAMLVLSILCMECMES